MKIIFTIACYLFFSSAVWSKGDLTPMAGMTVGVALGAKGEFEATGNWPPMDKLISIEQSALRTKAPGKLVLFNTLAGVPGMPLLKLDGERIKYPGFRLYAISRVPNFDNAFTPEGKRVGGRFAILFKEENGKSINLEIPWIVESEAQIILQQIGGFDPKKAPFVFEETYVKLGGDVKKLYQLNHSATIYKIRDRPTRFDLSLPANRPSNSQLVWILGVVILLISVIGYVVRQKR